MFTQIKGKQIGDKTINWIVCCRKERWKIMKLDEMN